MKKKKILFFIYQFGGGGAARTLLNILNHIDRDEFEPILVTLDFAGDYEPALKSDVTFIKLPTKRLRNSIIPLAKLIRKQKPDIVFSTVPTYNIIAVTARLLSFTRTKNIVREAAFLGEENSRNLKLKMIGFLYRFSSQVISLSNGVKENLIKRYHVNHDKITVIYNPIDLNNIQDLAINGQMPEEHEKIFNSGKKVLVTAGRFVVDKDQKTLLAAFADVKKTIDSELVILGEGELENELRKQAKQLGIESCVHFIGFQKNPYMYFSRADVFVLTSLREGFGHVLVEALATGTPVVSTKCKPGAEEVLAHGEFGKLCEVGNASELANKIVNILQLDEQERRAVVEKGKQRANDFKAETIVKQYEAVFLETLGQTGHKKMRSMNQ